MFIHVPLPLYINVPVNPLTKSRYMHWFVTRGVLCHSTVTKILKRRCGWHTPGGTRGRGDDPSQSSRSDSL